MINCITRGILLALAALFLWNAPRLAAASADRYAAVAFSPATGRFGDGTNYPTKEAAIARALRECGQSDARTSWCRNSWIALAISNQSRGGFGEGYGSTAAAARHAAIQKCRSLNPDAHVVVCVSSYAH